VNQGVWRASLLLYTLAALPRDARAAESPAPASPVAAVAEWGLAQLVPSPRLVFGGESIGGGLRWQVTPLLYSFGIAERPWRTFLIAPLSRQAGSIELHLSPEWACCAREGQTSWLLRAGLRAYFPLAEHGEKLSASLGGSYHRAAGGGGWAADAGIYTFTGIFGLLLTVSPALPGRQVVAALTIRYF